jgi:metal-dependent amidase/aminoacylase/carboxypeptidase family protein
MSGAGLNVVTLTRKVSTDFANISLICPSASIFFQITRAGEHIPLHSPEFQKAAGTDYAFEQALKAAQAMAGTALRYLTDAKFRRSVQDYFKK